MIFACKRYIGSDDPTDDYSELREYMKGFIHKKYRFYRHDGALYAYVRRKMILRIKHDGIYRCSEREFFYRLQDRIKQGEKLKVDFSRFAISDFAKRIFYEVCKANKVPIHKSLIVGEYTKNHVKLSQENIWHKRLVLYEMNDDYPYGKFCVQCNKTNTTTFMEVPEDIVLKIKEKTTYLPKIR